MIVWVKCAVRIADCFFDEAPVTVRADIIRCHQQSRPLTGWDCTLFHTRLIDLRQSPDQILAAMEPDNRRSILRSAKKDSLAHCWLGDRNTSLLQGVFRLQDRSSALKGQPRTNRTRLTAMWQARSLDISVMRDGSGKPLVWRIYYRGTRRARNLYNGSLHRAVHDSAQRSLIGRAHRYLVWMDILRFKNAGLDTYDFGGWYTGNNDIDKSKINLFKKEFGGTIEESFNCVRGITLRGKLILALSAVRERWTLRERSGANILDGGAREAPGAKFTSREVTLS
jgi:hypothetical protein